MHYLPLILQPEELLRFLLSVSYFPWPTAPQHCFVGLVQISRVRNMNERPKIRILPHTNSFGSTFQSAA